ILPRDLVSKPEGHMIAFQQSIGNCRLSPLHLHLSADLLECLGNVQGVVSLPPGVVFMTFHFREAAANLLTIDALDPVAKIPEFKVCAVRVEKI
ncbi:hypothetical protein MUP59_06230, partial [Candidatus Bathyarchaeota archaeon]|nr:hypothetical protein [Candidatus Bathyarchaeota archaeon]